VIATKFASPMGEGPMTAGTSRRWIMQAVEDSLRRLDTDYIDLYQVHRPDLDTPDDETLRALDDLVRSGKVRYIGNSNYSGWQIAHNHWIAETRGYTPFISAQNEYSLLNRRIEAEVIPAAEKFGLGLLPFFPLASGLLTGKYKRDERPEGSRLSSGPMADRMLTDRNFETVERLEEFATQRGHTLLELAFSWLATQRFVGSVIAGATRPEQVKANAAAASWRLTPEEMAEVDQITKR
jgi:aryl-alcohol dehydrogenase-like predicted oxidoreductase